ncbi:MAG: hypothetical protein IKK93_01045 [Campylobacter sp.]|nr:hypothetical protein [Campylobacter sp.]
MNKNWVHAHHNMVDFTFTCDRSPKKIRSYKTKFDDNHDVTVVLQQFKHRKKRCVVSASIHEKDYQYSYPIFFWRLEYKVGQKYNLRYDIDKELDKLKFISYDDPGFSLLKNNRTEVTKKGPLMVSKYLHPNNAKYLMREIKAKHFMSKFYWDSYMGYYDCYCKACETKHNRFWLGNPDIGYVRPTKQIELNTIMYHGKLYNPCKDNEYNRVQYWNKEEYKKMAERYKPTIKDATWLDYSEFNEKLSKNEIFAKKVGMDTFETLWEKNKHWRFTNTDGLKGKVYKEGELPEEYKKLMNISTACTKVVTLLFKEWENDWIPFEKYWKKNVLTQPDIDSNGNIYGGGWRDLETGNVIGRETDHLLDTSKYEKVVTFGWHASKPKNAIRCPVCDDLYDIMYSGYDMVPWYLQIKEPFLKIKDKIKKKKDPNYGI